MILLLFLKSLKLFNNLSLSIIISDKKGNLNLTKHSHSAFFLFKLYPLYSQPFSHKDRLLSKNYCLSFKIISVWYSVVYGKQISL